MFQLDWFMIVGYFEHLQSECTEVASLICEQRYGLICGLMHSVYLDSEVKTGYTHKAGQPLIWLEKMPAYLLFWGLCSSARERVGGGGVKEKHGGHLMCFSVPFKLKHTTVGTKPRELGKKAIWTWHAATVAMCNDMPEMAELGLFSTGQCRQSPWPLPELRAQKMKLVLQTVSTTYSFHPFTLTYFRNLFRPQPGWI